MTDPQRIGPRDALARLSDGYTYLDVRTEAEFAAGHPMGAYNVPLMLATGGAMQPNARFLEVAHAAFPLDAKLVVGCKGGNRSLRAAKLLAEAGYGSLLEQRAGWDGARDPFGQVVEKGWTQEGLPTESGEPAGRSYADLLRRADGATRSS